MLKIKDLRVNLEDENKEILKGVNLTVEAGKVHAIMDQMDPGNLLCLTFCLEKKATKSQMEPSH